MELQFHGLRGVTAVPVHEFTRHRFPPLLAAVAAALLAAVAGRALAGEVAGRITDAATGRALPNATVRIPELNRATRADRSGDYRFSDLPAGDYTVVAEYVGFGDASGKVAVQASGASSLPIALAGVAVGTGIEEVTVTRYRLAQATALQDKKSAKVIKESITADDAGKLPDQNAGDTLARVTGVAVTTDQGEGRYVTIRGIDAALSNVTIDGQTIGSPEGDTRRVAMDTIPANILSKLEVIKSVTPDLDGNAIGGTVNLVTPSAFDDPDGRSFSATADYGYSDLGEQHPWGASAAWSGVFADDRLGVVLSASYSDRKFNSENVQGGDPWTDDGGDYPYLIPDEQNIRDYLIRRVRKGFVANFEFRPNDTTRLHWRNIVNRYEDTELQPEVTYDYRNGDLENVTPTSGLFTEGEGKRENSERFEIQKILSSTIGGEFEIGRWTLALAATYGKTEQDTPYDNDYVFEADDVFPMTYDISDYYWHVDAPADFYDASLYEFDEAKRGHQLIEEKLKVGQIDLRRDIEWGDGHDGFIKGGAKYISRRNSSDQDMIVYDGFDGDDDFLLSQVAAAGNRSFYRDVRPYYTFGPYPDYRLAERFFRDNAGDFEVSAEDTVIESYGVDYSVKEDVTAGYLMASLDVGNATFVGGVRVERTETDFSAYDVQIVDGDAQDPPPQVTGTKNYTNWLPGLQMTWSIRDDLIARAAWTNTIGRPSYEQNVPFRIFEIEEDDPDVFEGAIEMGNPELDALESANYDLALEWYLRPTGILSGGLFYKDIDHPIFTRLQTLEDVTFEGRFYSELETEQAQNASNGNIFGIEFSYQQQFSMLPGFLRGLGVSVGYTWTDSEADAPGRSAKVPFFMQSEHVANAALFYEMAGLELRLGYAYRSEYLYALGDAVAEDLYIDRHGQLDFKASYDFTKQVGAFFQVNNITNEPLRYVSGTRARLAENEFYSWSMMAGVSVKF